MERGKRFTGEPQCERDDRACPVRIEPLTPQMEELLAFYARCNRERDAWSGVVTIHTIKALAVPELFDLEVDAFLLEFFDECEAEILKQKKRKADNEARPPV